MAAQSAFALLQDYERRSIAHVAAAPVFDDSSLAPGDIRSPAHWVTSLAYLKAWSQARSNPDSPIVLGSDTACVLDGRLIGTPADAIEAEGMIRAFMERRHEVVTGVAIIDRRGGSAGNGRIVLATGAGNRQAQARANSRTARKNSIAHRLRQQRRRIFCQCSA